MVKTRHFLLRDRTVENEDIVHIAPELPLITGRVNDHQSTQSQRRSGKRERHGTSDLRDFIFFNRDIPRIRQPHPGLVVVNH